MDKRFRIGDFSFRLMCPDEVRPPENFMKFESDAAAPDYAYRIALADALPEPEGRRIALRKDLLVLERDGLETRYVSETGAAPYACYRETAADSAEILLLPRVLGELKYDTMFSSLFAFERRMIGRQALVLHSAYIRTERGAILFSAPSGTGKSTQAGLWERYRGVKQLNGDRSLLQKAGGVWQACGWPVCGSSEICNNESTPIRAIVMLSQAPENRIERLGPMAAFSQLYTQITVNRWSRDFQNRAMDLIEALTREIPVYHLACTISREAVELLADTLENDERRQENGYGRKQDHLQ